MLDTPDPHKKQTKTPLFPVYLQINVLSFDLCSAIKLRPKEGETYFDVMAVIDPVTRESQRLAPLLLVGTAAEAVLSCI